MIPANRCPDASRIQAASALWWSLKALNTCEELSKQKIDAFQGIDSDESHFQPPAPVRWVAIRFSAPIDACIDRSTSTSIEYNSGYRWFDFQVHLIDDFVFFGCDANCAL